MCSISLLKSDKGCTVYDMPSFNKFLVSIRIAEPQFTFLCILVSVGLDFFCERARTMGIGIFNVGSIAELFSTEVYQFMLVPTAHLCFLIHTHDLKILCSVFSFLLSSCIVS